MPLDYKYQIQLIPCDQCYREHHPFKRNDQRWYHDQLEDKIFTNFREILPRKILKSYLAKFKETRTSLINRSLINQPIANSLHSEVDTPIYTDPICSCMLRTVHTAPITAPLVRVLRRNRGSSIAKPCHSRIEMKQLNKAKGWFKKIHHTINNRPIWRRKGGVKLLWSNDVFGLKKSGARKSGWVIVSNNKIRSFNPHSDRCPSDNWRHLSRKMQRFFHSTM